MPPPAPRPVPPSTSCGNSADSAAPAGPARDHDGLHFCIGAIHVGDDAVRVPLQGALDLASGAELIAGVTLLGDPAPGSVRRYEPGTVQLDLSGLAFLDTAGLTALNEARNVLTDAGWRVCLTRPQPRVLRFFEMAIAAGWCAGDTACADVEHWGRLVPTQFTVAPWPPVAVAGSDTAGGRA